MKKWDKRRCSISKHCIIPCTAAAQSVFERFINIRHLSYHERHVCCSSLDIKGQRSLSQSKFREQTPPPTHSNPLAPPSSLHTARAAVLGCSTGNKEPLSIVPPRVRNSASRPGAPPLGLGHDEETPGGPESADGIRLKVKHKWKPEQVQIWKITAV